jgi:hypothetical protein
VTLGIANELPMLLPDSRGGVVSVLSGPDPSIVGDDKYVITVRQFGESGELVWRRTLPFEEGIALGASVTPTGTVLITGVYVRWNTPRPGPQASGHRPFDRDSFITELDARGRSLWEKRLPSEGAPMDQLYVTTDSIFITGEVQQWIEIGEARLVNAVGVHPMDGALGVAAFDRSGVPRWSFLARKLRPGPISLMGNLLVVSVRVLAPWRAPGGPEIGIGNEILAFDALGRLAWHKPLRPHESTAALAGTGAGLAMLSSADNYSGIESLSESFILIDERGAEIARRELWRRESGWLFGDRIVPLEPFGRPGKTAARSAFATTEPTGRNFLANDRREYLLAASDDTPVPRYVLLNAAGEKGLERTPLHPLNPPASPPALALGDDGSVFESGLCAGSNVAYLARVR